MDVKLNIEDFRSKRKTNSFAREVVSYYDENMKEIWEANDIFYAEKEFITHYESWECDEDFEFLGLDYISNILNVARVGQDILSVLNMGQCDALFEALRIEEDFLYMKRPFEKAPAELQQKFIKRVSESDNIVFEIIYTTYDFQIARDMTRWSLPQSNYSMKNMQSVEDEALYNAQQERIEIRNNSMNFGAYFFSDSFKVLFYERVADKISQSIIYSEIISKHNKIEYEMGMTSDVVGNDSKNLRKTKESKTIKKKFGYKHINSQFLDSSYTFLTEKGTVDQKMTSRETFKVIMLGQTWGLDKDRRIHLNKNMKYFVFFMCNLMKKCKDEEKESCSISPTNMQNSERIYRKNKIYSERLFTSRKSDVLGMVLIDHSEEYLGDIWDELIKKADKKNMS